METHAECICKSLYPIQETEIANVVQDKFTERKADDLEYVCPFTMHHQFLGAKRAILIHIADERLYARMRVMIEKRM